MSAFENAETAFVSTTQEVDWASVYDELLPKVYHYFCLRVGNRIEAEDLAASTFERAWRDRERYRKDLGGFTNWLFGIARHVLVDHYRKNQREKPFSHEIRVEESIQPLEEEAIHKEGFEHIVRVLATLPEREREIFSLKFGAQFTNRAIAKITKLTESNVGTILHRLVSRMREQMEDEK